MYRKAGISYPRQYIEIILKIITTLIVDQLRIGDQASSQMVRLQRPDKRSCRARRAQLWRWHPMEANAGLWPPKMSNARLCLAEAVREVLRKIRDPVDLIC
jgi:hypothetical protein